MSENKVETVKGLCVVALTKHLMEKLGILQDKAYARLIQTELYQLLMDTETNLFLETNAYLCMACDKELDSGIDSLYEFINT